MKKKIISILTAALMLSSVGVSATEVKRVELNSDGSEIVTLIVEVEGEALLTEDSATTYAVSDRQSEIVDSHSRVMAELNDEIDEDAQRGFIYTALFNGFSIETDSSNIDAIKALDGVKNVYIAGESYIIEPYLESSSDMIGTPSSYDLGYKGEGMAVAIIDAGCDTGHDFFEAAPTNPKYSKSEMENLIGSVTLNSGVTNAESVYNNEKIPYAYNYRYKTTDTYLSGQNHGTHVAGIVAGKNGTMPDGTVFSGVAPEAQLFIMSCGTASGAINDAAVVAAINDAALLGADVINMSFGIDYCDSKKTFSYSSLLRSARDAGIMVMVAAGNSSRGFYDETPLADNIDYSAAGVPANHNAVTAVASATNAGYRRNYWAVTNETGEEFKIYQAHTGTHLPSILYTNAYTEYIYCGTGSAEEFANVDVSGKIALVERGSLAFALKAENAMAAGAIGIIIANTEDEIFTCVPLCLPAACTTKSMGETMAAAENKRILYSGVKEEVAKSPVGGQISYFSSWGMDGSLQLKPEITAPGGNIYSSINGDKYKLMSGTSMATPHMAGVSALAMQYYKSNPFLDEYNNLTGGDKVDLIENIMMTSADIIRDENNVAQSPRVQGAGLVNIENMLKSKVVIEGDSGKAKLSLGDRVTDVLDISFDVTNISKKTVTFDNISAEIMTDGYTQTDGEYFVGDTVSLDVVSETLPDTVTIEPGESYKFSGTVTLDKSALEENKKVFTNGFYIDGFISLDGEDTNASIPLVGFYGGWGEAPVFDNTIYDEGGSNLLIPDYEDVSGTYLSMVYSNAEIVMGSNIWFNELCDKEHIAFPSGAVGLRITNTNHRAIENYAYSIANSAGKTICTTAVSTNVINKYTPVVMTFSKVNTRSLPEGDYSVNVTGNAVGDTDITHKLSIPFVVDKTPPAILEAEFDEANKNVTVSALDNHYIAAVYAQYTGANGKTVTKYGKVTDAEDARGKQHTLSLDISDITDTDSLVVGAYDFATNGTYYAIDYFEDMIGAEVAALSRGEGVTSATFNVRNNSGKEVSKKFAVAFYDAENALVAMDCQDVKLIEGEEKSITYPMLQDTQEATYAKLFIWEWDRLLPYDTAKKFVFN